jgi:hypothetical protein
MKLMSKERIGGRIKGKYGRPLTPYQSLMDSQHLSQEAEQRLAEAYLPLHPAALKRAIDAKINSLLTAYQTKNRTSGADPHRKLGHRWVTFLNELTRRGNQRGLMNGRARASQLTPR